MNHLNFNAARTIVLACTLIGFSAISTLAQDRLDPVSMGMARSGVSLARGLSSLTTNPGGLGYLTSGFSGLAHDLQVSVYSGGGSIGGTYLAGDEFSQIFGPIDGQNDESRERLGELLVDDRLFANGGINFLTAVWRLKGGAGTLGLTYGSRAYARVNFPDDLANLIATSNIATKDFRFVNRGIGATWLTDFGISYGRTFGSVGDEGWFPTVGLGLNARLIGGVVHFEVDDNSALYIDQINVAGSLQFLIRGGYTFRSAEPDQFDQVNAVSNFLGNPFPATSGFGFATDLGVSGVMYREGSSTVHYGAVIGNVGQITWSNKARERRGVNFQDTLGASLGSEEYARFEGNLLPVPDYSSSLPSTVRAGLGYSTVDLDRHSSIMVGLEGEVPLNQVPGNTPDPRIGAGIDWTPNEYVSLRGGLSVGGISDASIAFGIGIRPVEWMTIDVGTSELNSLLSGDRLDLAGRVAFGFTPNGGSGD